MGRIPARRPTVVLDLTAIELPTSNLRAALFIEAAYQDANGAVRIYPTRQPIGYYRGMTDQDAIHRIIASAIKEARRAGLDYVWQTQKAIDRALRQ